MSYNTQLQSNNTDLQSILATINSLPEAGSGGSGGSTVETCTVTVNFSDNPSLGIYATILDENGQVCSSIIDNVQNTTINNIVCGSVLTVIEYSSSSITISTSGAETLGKWQTTYMFSITAAANETAIIDIQYSGSGGY